MTSPLYRVALVGQPNAGKSTLFNVLSDIKTHSSNFSGTTVEIVTSTISLGGRPCLLIDLPGAYSLNPGDEAERVTLEYLLHEPLDLIVNVVDSTLMSRSLELTVELLELGLPLVVALNQQDEAERRGMRIDVAALETRLQVPVIPTSARLGKGIGRLTETCRQRLGQPAPTRSPLHFTSHIESRLERIAAAMERHQETEPERPRRFLAIKSLENPDLVPPPLREAVAAEIHAACQEIEHLHEQDCLEAIAHERHHLAMKITEQTSRFIDRKTIPRRDILDRYLLHPLLGQLILLLFFLAYFGLVFVVGNLLSGLLSPLLTAVPRLYASWHTTHPWLWTFSDGIFQGLAGSLGIILPYFLPLIFLTSLFEDTGYLARIAFLLDGLVHRIGLHGKSVASFVMGLGCSVPALVSTRILENRRDRFLSAVLIPFIPCSARHAVIFSLTAAFLGPLWAFILYFFVLVVIAVTGKTLSLFLPKPLGLIMEIPELKIPSLRSAAANTLLRLKEFCLQVVPILVGGSLILSAFTVLHLDVWVNRLFAPFLHLLALPAQLGSTLVFGFFRKELIIVMAGQALGVSSLAQLPLTPHQIVVFLVFVTLYFPCFSTFVTMWKEFGARTALASGALSVGVASISALGFHLALHAFGIF